MPDLDSMKTNLSDLILDIQKKSVLLPHFQRDFVWKEEEMQKKLIASVLARMPIGSILLLQGSKDDYCSREIGKKTTIDIQDIPDKVDYLLDGQQRTTVLTNVFSNAIFDDIGSDYSKLIKPVALMNRFFLRLPKWEMIEKGYVEDIFNTRHMKFPFQSESEDPRFLSGDVYKYIKVVPFKEGDDINPYSPLNIQSDKLLDFCISNNDDGYYIPLYLLIETGDEEQVIRISQTLQDIICEISNRLKYALKNRIIDKGVGTDKFKNEIRDVFVSIPEKDKERLENGDLDLLEEKLKARAYRWAEQMKKYLFACIKQMKLTRIHVSAKDRFRAIDIYENLNLGGVSLSTFDLIMAKVATIDKEKNFLERIIDGMKTKRTYPLNVLPDNTADYLEDKINDEYYTATIQTECYDERKSEIAKDYITVFLDVLGLVVENEEANPDKYNVDHMKQNRILGIKPEIINDKCEIIIEAIDRALFFFQTRLGIRSIQEINYRLMIVLVATVFLNKEHFKNTKVHRLLEAWYWSSVFSGTYDTDQNTTMIEDLKLVTKTITGDYDKHWILSREESVLNQPFFSDKAMVLMERYESAARLPKKLLRFLVCQYYLSRPYKALFDKDKVISVFTEEKLEAHHIIPLGSCTKIGESTKQLRKEDKNICNSPMNFVYITKRENDLIGSKDMNQYIASANPMALECLQIDAIAPDDVSIDDQKTTNSKIKTKLSRRFDRLQNSIKLRIEDCLSCW